MYAKISVKNLNMHFTLKKLLNMRKYTKEKKMHSNKYVNAFNSESFLSTFQ